MRSLLLILAFLMSAPHALAATEGVTGFLSIPIWHTPDVYYVGDTVRIYAALMNSSSADVTGTLKFSVNDKVIGSRTFTMRAQDQVITVWYDWEATAGSHTFSANIDGTSFSVMGSPTEAVPRIIATSPRITATTSVKKVAPMVTKASEGDEATTSLGTVLDAAADAARASLEDARNALDTKIALQAAYVAGTSGTPNTSSSTAAEHPSGFFQSAYLWLLNIFRWLLSFGIGILKSPLWTALALVALFMLGMKIAEIMFRMVSGSKRD